MKRMPCFAVPWFLKAEELLIDLSAFLHEIIVSGKMPHPLEILEADRTEEIHRAHTLGFWI